MAEAVEIRARFAWPVRVYWEDTDAGGVVYHASYIRFFERARSEWLRTLGVAQQQLRENDGIVFVVRELEVTYNAPARLDELLSATMRPFDLRSASFSAEQELLREPEPTPLVHARVRIACLDAASFRPCRIPDHLIEKIGQA